MKIEKGKYYWVLRNKESKEWEPARADKSWSLKKSDKLSFFFTDSSTQHVDNVYAYKEMKTPNSVEI